MQPIDATLAHTLRDHRIHTDTVDSVTLGRVRFAPAKSLWVFAMAIGAVVGGVATFSWSAFALFVVSTGTVLLLGHSLGSHRKLIHNSFQCPKAVEYVLVYFGVQVGLSGPLGLLRQHELRDFAQRLPICHDFLRHGRGFWTDAWWQLHCDLHLNNPPELRIEDRIASDRFYLWLERTWMWQQLPWAILFFVWGGWAFVFWGVCARVTAGVMGHWLIGYFAHNAGGMHHVVKGAAVQGRNISMASLLTMGECWHNNHHAFPGSAKLGLHKGEWDPGWWTLLAMERLGLVWNMRLPKDLPPRAELESLPLVQRPWIPRATIGSIVSLAKATTMVPLPAVLSWPAFYISKQTMQKWTGNALTLDADASNSHLRLDLNGQSLVGLPALYVALTRQMAILQRLAWLLVPIVAGCERLRPSVRRGR
jgi:stearoyl-CoA desaturase (delta-9 desaturase)